MKVLVFGNSGSGKSTYAKALAARERIPHLDLDTIVWEPGQIAVLRPADAIRASLEQFIAGNATWVIEGCYGDLMLGNLQAWVSGYYERTDQWSYDAHRRIFDAHEGPKVERTSA